MINVQVLPNGNMLLTADNDGRAVSPEAIGALTDSPIICAEIFQPVPDDEGESYNVDPEAVFYWFPNYQVCDPWEQLKNCGRVEFHCS